MHLIKVRLAKLEGCLRDCVAVAKHPQNTAQRSGITRYDEWYIISLTFTIKIITLLFGVHAFNAFQEAAPGSGSLEVWSRWDSLAYLNVAQHGYTSTGPNRVQLVMLPLYPFCVHAFYFDIVEARAAKEYWDIRPLPRGDRKIVTLR